MNDLKPSELPVDTVIGTIGPHYQELFIKRSNGIWEDLFSGCGCCEPHVRVADAGWGEDKEPSTYDISCPVTRNETSDEYFGTDFKIIALPMSVVNHIVEEFAVMTFSSGILEDALESVRSAEKEA
jgi:hypothetical protein